MTLLILHVTIVAKQVELSVEHLISHISNYHACGGAEARYIDTKVGYNYSQELIPIPRAKHSYPTKPKPSDLFKLCKVG